MFNPYAGNQSTWHEDIAIICKHFITLPGAKMMIETRGVEMLVTRSWKMSAPHRNAGATAVGETPRNCISLSLIINLYA